MAWNCGLRATLRWLGARRVASLFLPSAALAGVLADDRADMLYHRYDGGGVTIHGPSVLVRKKIAEKYAVSANYYRTWSPAPRSTSRSRGASEYKEERDQYSLGLEYLRGKTTYNLGYTNSKENDYQAETTIVRHQPGPVRRPDDDQHGLLARQGRRAPPRHDHRPDRSDLQGADRPLELSRRRVADPDQEPHQLAAAGSDHRRGLPQQSVSLVPLRQSERRPPVRAGHGDLSAHAHQQRGRVERALLPALSRGRARRLSLLHGHVGHRRQHVRSWATRIRWARGRSKPAIATTRRTTPTSTATCSTARTSRTSWRATRSCRRSTARR